MGNNLKIVSSQYKHLLDRKDDYINVRTINRASILKNEPFSFQALYRAEGGRFSHPVSISIKTSLPAKAWRVDYVPVTNAQANASGNEYEAVEPGLYPDVLTPRPTNPEIVTLGKTNRFSFEKNTVATLNATADNYGAVWFTVNPYSKTMLSGEYEIEIELISLITNETLEKEFLHLKIIDELLPHQDFYYTNWLHVDCLCEFYSVKAYSNYFYKIFDKFVLNMTEHGQNTLLLPAFTPALDTVEGEERMNVQLIDIEKCKSGYKFDFSKMRKFVRRAKRNGIEFFEHTHLFSQWGAKNAPNIYDVHGNRIFGFDTEAGSDEYIRFLRDYLTEFIKFAKDEKIEKNLIFHLSDEPVKEQIENYRIAHKAVSDLLIGNPICDAMYDFTLHEAGLVDQPIIATKNLGNYDFDRRDTMWLYYTGGDESTSNRKISNTAAATRAIGIHMYKYRAKGFLHWAYNYYYDRLSFGYSAPQAFPNAYKALPGISYLAYPVNERGEKTVTPSIREKLMREAMDDLRALKLLELKIGREKTLALCEEKLGAINVFTIPKGDALRELREIINAKIEECVQCDPAR
jgi:hypothetical protein